MTSIYIVKSNGDKELFSEKKLYNSVKRVAIFDDETSKIFESVKKEIYPGIKTSEIFKKIKTLLRKNYKSGAMKFNIKEGMRKLGPTGFPFEKFIAEVFRKLGYQVKINQHIPGACIKDYEIDLIAKKENFIYLGECKYRNLAGDKVHQNDALANHARFQDILHGDYFKKEISDNYKMKTILITNTKFTNNAYDYSTCVGVDLLGWNTPMGNGLENLIAKHHLYPVTLLPSLKGYLKDILVSQEIMLVSDVIKIKPEIFSKKFNVPISSILLLIKEAESLLG